MECRLPVCRWTCVLSGRRWPDNLVNCTAVLFLPEHPHAPAPPRPSKVQSHSSKATSTVALPWLPWESQLLLLGAPSALGQVSMTALVEVYCGDVPLSLPYGTMNSWGLSHLRIPNTTHLAQPTTSSGSWLCQWELKSRGGERSQGRAKGIKAMCCKDIIQIFQASSSVEVISLRNNMARTLNYLCQFTEFNLSLTHTSLWFPHVVVHR